MLFQFLNDTQTGSHGRTPEIYKADLEETIVSFFNAEATRHVAAMLALTEARTGNFQYELELMYTKSGTNFNRELLAKYEQEHLFLSSWR